jgi:hypothetical protein
MTDATVLTDRFDRALLYATHVHGGQVRKDTPIPYIAHLLAVSATVLEYDGSEDVAIAALLHDAVEDQGGEPRLSDIRNRFGDRVADIVRSCSDTVVNSSSVNKKKIGTPARSATLNTSIWSIKALFLCPSPIKYTTLARFFVTFVSQKSAKRCGIDLRTPGKTRFGTIGSLRSHSRSA